jgi:DNA polymerase III epsilon subunit-like protein
VTPLAASLRAIFVELGPLSAAGLGKHLRRRGPAAVPVDAIERELQGNRDHFRSLGDGRWDLAERVDVEPAPDPRPETEPVDPMIVGGLSTDVVVIDIETTGTDAERDEIIQVAAVRFVGGEPVAALNRHVAPVAMSVPEPLRVRMGWDPARPSQQVSLADAFDALTRFVADDPLLAWNAAFEQAFLAKETSAPTMLIDGLAVAVLARPRGPHRLDYLVGLLELDPHGFLSTGPIDGPRPATARAHDALYDCVAAGLVHAAMVDVLREGVGPEVAGLLPELDLVDRAPPRPRPPWRSAGAASTAQRDAE